MKKRKRLLSLFLVLAMLIGVLPSSVFAAQIVASGYCGGEGDGTNLSWVLDSEGTLTISGTGKMMDYGIYIDTSAPWSDYRSLIKTIAIDKDATTIGSNTFRSCYNLVSLVVGDGVTKIGDYAFAYCKNLGSVLIGENVLQLGSYAFSGCQSLEAVAIPDSVTSIGYGTFFECTNLTSVIIGNGVTQIGTIAFGSCDNLASLIMGDSVRWIGQQAFTGCESLQSVTFPESLEHIGLYAFMGCESLKTLNIPSGVTSIGSEAFSLALSLTYINVDDNNRTYCDIDGVLFNKQKTKLICCPSNYEETVYTIPDGVTTIGSRAFNFCKKLTQIELPDSVHTIAEEAFWSCERLNYLIIPDRVTTIGSNATVNCHCLSAVFFKGDAPQVDQGMRLPASAILYYIPGTSGWTDSSAYNAAAGTWNGYKLAVWEGAGKPGIQLQTGEYYSVPEKRRFDIIALGADAYPYPTGRTVTVGNESYTVKDKNEKKSSLDHITAAIPEGYTGNVTISMEGYHDCVLPVGLTDQENDILLFPEAVNKPFTQALFLDESASDKARSYKDLLHEVIYLDEVSIADAEGSYILNLYPLVNWNGHGEGSVWLEQGEIQIPLAANQFNQVDWMDYFFDPHQDIFVCTEGADGSITRLELAIHIYANRTSELDFNLGEMLSADTSESNNENLDILEDMELSLDMKGDVASIEFAVQSDGTIQGVIGLAIGKKSFSDEGAWAPTSTRDQDIRNVYNETKNVIKQLKDKSQDQVCQGVADYLDELAAKGVKPTNSHGKFGVDGKVQLLGYITGKFENGKPVLTEVETILVVKGSTSYTHNTVINVLTVPVPAYFKITLAAEIGAYVKMEYVAALKELQPAAAMSEGLKGKISLTGETGPGWEGYLSGGVYGSGALKANTSLPIAKANTYFSLQADFGFVGSLGGHGGKWKVLETDEYIFWDAGDWCWKSAEDAQALAFEPDLTRSVMLMSAAEDDSVATGVNGYTAPQLAKLSDGRFLAVWTADVTSRGSADKNGIFYSICTDGIWSAATLVCDDNTNDSMPELYEKDGMVYLAWQNYSRLFGEMLPDYETVTGQINTVLASFDEVDGLWSVPEITTPDWYLKETALPEDYEGDWPLTSSKRLSLTDEHTRVVVYTAADETGSNQIYGIFHDGFAWGEPVQLTQEKRGVNGFHATLNQDGILLLFTCGDASSASLKFEQISFGADIVVHSADYIRSSFVSGGTMSVKVAIENRGTIPVEGVVVNIGREGAEPLSESVGVRFDSGETDTIYISYPLPDTIDFDQLQVSVSTINGEETNLQNNAAVCELSLADVSVESPSAISREDFTEVSVQIVNRGHISTGETTLTYHKDAPDGDVLGTVTVPALDIGDLVDVTREFSGISAGTLIYLDVAELENENIIANNSTQTMVIAQEITNLSVSASAKNEGGQLILDFTVSNQDITPSEPLYIVAAMYDGISGKQLAYSIREVAKIDALSVYQDSAFFTLSSDLDSIAWKIFVLKDGYKPARNPVSGVIAKS